MGEGHDVPLDVLDNALHWLRRGLQLASEGGIGFDMGGYDAVYQLDMFRRSALEGAKHCFNDGCEVVGHLKDFKVCPQCKTARYCSDTCQKQDWNAGGHKATCGTFAGFGH